MKSRLTTCIYCGCGCNFHFVLEDGRIVGIQPSKDHPVSKGGLCVKGWNAHQFIYHPERLTMPLIKKQGKFVEAGWPETLDLTASRLTRIKADYGPESIGVFGSAKCTNEENFLIMKFARVALGTNNIDHCARLCHASTVAGLRASFGSGAMTNSIVDIDGAEVILVTGSDTTQQHPLIASRIINAARRGAALIVVDPRSIHLAKFAGYHLRQAPGTDVAWLNGFMRVIIREGLQDTEFIEKRTEGFEQLRKAVEKYTPEAVEKITSIDRNLLIEAARIFAGSKKSMIVYSMGITQHTTGVDNVLSCANLAMLTGNVGRPFTGVNPLRGQNNVQGACDMGALPDVYSGYQKAGDKEIKDKFSKAWGRDLPDKPGLTVTEMIDAAGGGKIKALYMMGENPMLSDPDINHVKKALKKADFLVCQDIFLSETAELADVVLPACSFAEKDGTFTNTERRVMRVRKAIEPLGGSMPDWKIICLLSERLGYEMDYASPAEIAEEAARLTPIYAGINYKRLQEHPFGLQWPCPDTGHPGTAFLHKDKFTRGKGVFYPVEFKPAAELPDDEYPFLLTTGRLYFQWHTMTMTGRSPSLDREAPECFVEMNPKDAEELGLRGGAAVRVSSRRGAIEPKIMVTEKIPRKTVFIPFHFKEAAANILTNPALDPEAKIPEYKVCAVKVERVEKNERET